MQETKKGLATFKESLISNHLYFFPIKNVRKSYSVHLEEPHLLRLRCMENSKGLLNPIFDLRGLDSESKIVHLHILQCRLCNFQPHFKGIERDICDYFFSESPCLLCMLNPFFLIYVMKPSLHPLAVIST